MTKIQVSLGELVRLAFPQGASLPPAPFRDRAVKWVAIAGAGMTPEAGDVVLCGTEPSPAQLADWLDRGVVGVALVSEPSFANRAELPLVLLPPGVSLRQVQQTALQLIVNRQSYLIEYGTRVYQNLARHALEGEGLEGMARAMLELTGKTILVQDKRLKPLAQATTPVMAQVWAEVLDTLESWNQLPAEWRDRRQAALGGWREQPLPGGLARLVCPIVAKGMARGYLSIVGAAGELDALDQLMIEHGAAACALEMAKAKAVSEAEKRARGDLLDAVLTGSLPPEELIRWARRIGYDVEPPHVAMICRWGCAKEEKSAPSLRRLETLVNQSVAQQGASALVHPHGAEIILFCAEPASAQPEAALALAHTIQRAAAGEYPDCPVYFGVGRPAAELPEWKTSHREASQSLTIAERLGEPEPLYFGDLSVYRLLFLLEDNPELEAFCREILGPLLDYHGGGDLIETLEAFCDQLGNLSQTAEKLFIHRNSLLYRMERIAQLTGLDMNNPDTRLAVHLALKARKILQSPR